MNESSTERNYLVVDMLPEQSYPFIVLFLVVVGIIGVCSNVSVIILFFKHSVLRNPMNYILMNTIICDSIIGLYGVPVDTFAAYHHGWVMGKELCLATGFILMSVGESSMITLSVLSVQRYLIVVNPKRFRTVTKVTAAKVIVFVWTATLAMSVPPLLGWSFYIPESSGISCAPDWETYDYPFYTIFMLIIGFIIPTVVIIGFSYATHRKLLQQTDELITRSVRRLSIKRNKQISRLIFAMNFGFIVSWFPYGAISTTRFVFGKSVVQDGVSIWCLLFAKTSIIWNPFLYVTKNPTFRGLLRKKSPFFRKLLVSNRQRRNVFITLISQQYSNKKIPQDDDDSLDMAAEPQQQPVVHFSPTIPKCDVNSNQESEGENPPVIDDELGTNEPPDGTSRGTCDETSSAPPTQSTSTSSTIPDPKSGSGCKKVDFAPNDSICEDNDDV